MPPDPPPTDPTEPTVVDIEVDPGGLTEPLPRLALPRRIRGIWKRDLRLRGELVGKGVLELTDQGLSVKRARRSTPLRQGLWLFTWAGWWVVALTSTVGLALTAVGVANNLDDWRTLPLTVGLGLPFMWSLLTSLRYFLHRLLEPKVKTVVPWQQVRHLATDGRTLEIHADFDGRPLHARLQPTWGKKKARRALATIAAGGLSHHEVARARGWWRPAWFDQVLLLGAFGAIGVTAKHVEPTVSGWFADVGDPASGPLAGIPDPVGDVTLAAYDRACGHRSKAPGRLTNGRDGEALTWTSDLGPDSAIGHLRWQAGTARMELAQAPLVQSTGRLAGFFRTPEHLGLTFVSRAGDATSVGNLLASGRFDDWRSAWCSDMVQAMDVTIAKPGRAPGISASRSGDDLVVQVEPSVDKAWLLLPVRWYPAPGPEPYHACAVPELDGTPGLVEARRERTFSRFFQGPDQLARVYLVDPAQRALVDRLAAAGGVHPCMVVDSLRYSGAAVAVAMSGELEGGWLRQQAASMAGSPPMVPMATSADEAMTRIEHRWRDVVGVLAEKSTTDDDRRAVVDGFLDGVDWVPLLESVSFKKHLPRLELARQRLSGAWEPAQAGEQFLLALAENFLLTLPPDPKRHLARIRVGEAWLAVEAGTTWDAHGLTITVPHAAATYYELIGRYVLMDVARRLEDQLEASPTGTALPGEWMLVRAALEQHSIRIDVAKSTSRKALEAWVQGDFEYLADRVAKKTLERFQDQATAIAEAHSATYALATSWSDNQGVRYSELRRGGTDIGWVAQFSPQDTRASLHMGPVAHSDGLLLATAGSYVTQEGRTSGLAVVDGRVENFLPALDMDGLVIFHRTGLHTLNLDRGGTLPGSRSMLRPMHSLGDLHALISWLRREQASAFQTHLLVHDGAYTIDQAKASKDLRERRVLVRAEYQGNPIDVVIDLPAGGPGGMTLFEAAVTAVQALAAPEPAGPGLTVREIANLDVGSFNILEAWDAGGTSVMHGRVALDRAHNLILWRAR